MDGNELKDLRSAISQLPKVGGNTQWDIYRRAIRGHIMFEPIENFVNWSTIQATMFTGDCYIVEAAWKQLNNPTSFRYFNAMNENWVGNPPASQFNSKTSGNAIQKTYYAAMMESAFGQFHNIGDIFEFGAGYGILPYIIRRLGHIGNYILYDFPEFLLLQRYYLMANGIKAQYDFELEYRNVDLFIAISSLSESPNNVKQNILEKIQFKKCFIEFQPIWDGNDNIDFFKSFAQKNLAQWKILKSKINGHNYLIGIKNAI